MARNGYNRERRGNKQRREPFWSVRIAPSRLFMTVALLMTGFCRLLRAQDIDEIKRIDLALTAAKTYLLSCQSSDGAWRSKRYGFLKDGPSLTPHVAWALQTISTHEPRCV